MRLAVEPAAHGRVADQQQEDQHGLLDKRRPGFAGEPLCAMEGKRPSEKEIEKRGKKFEIGVQPPAGVNAFGHACLRRIARVYLITMVWTFQLEFQLCV